MSFSASLMAKILSGAMLFGGAVAAAAERVELPVTAYENARFFTPHWGEINGTVTAVDGAAQDGGVLEFTYDFSKCPDPNNSFARFDFFAPCPGLPQAFQCRIRAANARSPQPIHLFLQDKSGEVYLSRITVDWDGWRDVTFPVPAEPAWQGGDGNRRLDYPATVVGIGVDWPGTSARTGTLRFTPLRVVTAVDPDTCLDFTVSTSDWHWGAATVPVALNIASHAKTIQARYAGTLTVQDAYWQRPAATRTFEVTLPLAAPALTKAWDLPLPKGFYNCHAELRNVATGAVAAVKDWNLRVLLPSCSVPREDPLLAVYEYHGSPMRGGVFGDFAPPLADRMGARGVRLEPAWASLEPVRGRYAWDGLHQVVRELTAANVAIILLQTLYNGPAFIDPKDNPGFSAAYGALMRHQAAEFADRLKLFELGNEDNGSMKSAYTEVARNAAAGIRSVQPLAMVASTGIAGVDHTFIRQQAGRGLFDYLDAISVHPYTNNSTPSQAVSAERFTILPQLEELNAIAFEMGGMKALWCTEFGWPNADARGEHDRADLYVPAVRRLIALADRTGLEMQLAVAAGQAAYQARCAASLEVLAKCAERFRRDGLRRQFALFANLYMDRGGKLGERLYFVPGKPGTVKVRVTSWSKHERTATVRPELPPGWSCRPASAQVRVAPGTTAWTEFAVTAPAAAASGERLRMLTCLSGAPDVVAYFDDVEIVPAINVTVLPVAGLLPGAPLRLELANQEAAAVSGILKLMAPRMAGKPLATVVFKLAPAEKKIVTMKLDAVPDTVAAEWKYDAQFALADGRLFTLPGKDIDFAAATAAPAPLAIDGNPAKWRDALPLRLDQPEYARGSYGNGWSPEDGSATTWLKWDKEYLYFAARVTDQTFNQLFAGDSMWKQDSIQLVFAMPGSHRRDGMKEFTLALSPAGPKIWDGGEVGAPANRYLDEAKVFIRYAGKTITYEAAIPWSAFGPAFKEVLAGGTFRYAIAINDDDAIGGRKFLERFPGSVVYGKDVNTLVPVRLTGPAPARPATVPGGVGEAVFFDDFTSYATDSLPVGYDRVFNDMAPGSILVVKVAGRNALRLRANPKLRTGFNPGNPPYALLLAPLQLEPGATYELRALVKGRVSKDGAGTTLGVCSDRWGNQDYQYIQLPETMADWTPVSLRFGAPMTGEFRLILRDRAEECDLLIRDLRVVRAGR